METNNKLIAFLIVLCYCISAPSCRSLKKAINENETKTETTTQTSENSSFSLIDSSRTEKREIIKYTFQFSKPNFAWDPQRTGTSSSPDFHFEETESPPPIGPDWAALLARVNGLQIEIFRTQETQNQINSTGQLNSETTTQSSEETRSKSKDKTSDSTAAANIPWFAWILGALLIFGIVVYLVKQFKPI